MDGWTPFPSSSPSLLALLPLLSHPVAPTSFLRPFSSPKSSRRFGERYNPGYISYPLLTVEHMQRKDDSHKSWTGPNPLGPQVLQSWRGRVPLVPYRAVALRPWCSHINAKLYYCNLLRPVSPSVYRSISTRPARSVPTHPVQRRQKSTTTWRRRCRGVGVDLIKFGRRRRRCVRHCYRPTDHTSSCRPPDSSLYIYSSVSLCPRSSVATSHTQHLPTSPFS